MDYEIKGYIVEWKVNGKSYKKSGFSTEESAIAYAKEKLSSSDEVGITKLLSVLGWWT